MTANTIKAIAFDLDGTLVDSIPDLAESANCMRHHFSLPPLSLATLKNYVGDGISALVRRALMDGNKSEEAKMQEPEAEKFFLHYYAQHLTDKSYIYPGVEDVIPLLHKKGYPLAVISNKNELLVSKILAHFGLADSISLALGGNSLEEKKPSPLPLIHAANVLGVAKTELAMVGDSLNDAKAANSAASPFIALTYGYENDLQQKIKKNNLKTLAVIDHFEKLYSLFPEVNG